MGNLTIDFMKIQKNMEQLFEEYGYMATPEALSKLLDKWYEQKKTLLAAFETHPEYVGEGIIALTGTFKREINTRAIVAFTQWLIRHSTEEVATHEFYLFTTHLEKNEEDYLTEKNLEWINIINKMDASMRVRVGQKTSKVVNKVCRFLKFNEHPEWESQFAKYADAINPLTFERRIIISINPLDFLTMSFGNSWASCHTIDRKNKRGMPNSYHGQYSSGTISYMLDQSSFVVYTINDSYDKNEYYTQDKITRQMFHYQNDKLVQGRLYPQGNDYGSDKTYTEYRNVIQKVISECFNVNNYWILKRGSRSCRENTMTNGTHYADYENFDNCNISILKGTNNLDYVEIGAEPICIECGAEHDLEGSINCCHSGLFTCTRCECEIEDEDDVRYVDDSPYCEDCVSYCDECNEYHSEDNINWIPNFGYNGEYICNECLNNHNVCYCCDEYIEDSDEEIITWDGYVFCRSCGNERLIYIDSEGEYYDIQDDDIYNCYECREWHLCSNLIDVDGELYCETCAPVKDNEEE